MGDRETGVLVVVAQRRRRRWLRSDCGGSAAMAASDGGERWGSDGAAMGRSDGREGGGAAMAMVAQRRLWQCSDGNGDGGAAMGVAVVVVAADVHRPSLFACGCHLLLLTDALLSSPLTSGM
jgi:hypothetical protein